ncbi:MAG: hypothetical protein ABR559_06040 [Gemmatimonadota bacterium]
MDDSSISVTRRYGGYVLAGAVLLMGALFGANWLLDTRDLSPNLRIAVALVPVLGFAILIGLEVQIVRHLDEFQQRVQLEALAMAFPAAALLGYVVESLQKAGVAQEWTVGRVWPLMFLLYVPAYFLARWRYR